MRVLVRRAEPDPSPNPSPNPNPKPNPNPSPNPNQVNWAEALVPLVPPRLVSAGFHPRLLASGVGLLVLLLCPVGRLRAGARARARARVRVWVWGLELGVRVRG